MANVAIIIIRPHQRHIVGYLQPCMIDVKHLLVGDKHLGNYPHIEINVAGQQLSLVVYHLLQIVQFLTWSLHSLHGAVVQTAHANGIDHVLPLHLVEPLCPELQHLLPVGHVVVVAFASHLPLGGRRCAHRFAVASAHVDAILVGHLTVTLDGEERLTHLVHGGPVVVGTEAQHELEDALVRRRADDSPTPRQDAPVLVVDEDASIGHGRTLLAHKAFLQHPLAFPLRHTVGPPLPRRHTQQPRHLQQSVGHTVGVGPRQPQLPIQHLQQETFTCHAFVQHHDDASLLRFLHLHHTGIQHFRRILFQHLQRRLRHRFARLIKENRHLCALFPHKVLCHSQKNRNTGHQH